MLLPSHVGGANWQGGAFDPETGVLYVSSVTNADALGLARADPKRSDMAYVGAPRTAQQRGGPGSPTFGSEGAEQNIARIAPTANMGPQGLPLVKPPWGRITAIDLNSGEHLWMVPNGDAPDYIKNHPALKGIDLSKAGKPSRSPLIVTKTLLFGADGSNLFNAVAGGGGNTFRAYDKKTGKVVAEIQLPASATGIPMTYMADGRQFIAVAVGATGVPATLVALALP